MPSLPVVPAATVVTAVTAMTVVPAVTAMTVVPAVTAVITMSTDTDKSDTNQNDGIAKRDEQ